MLVSLALKNIRRSLRDYSVYFFTLVVGVTIFYAFNAVGSQTATMELTAERSRIMDLLQGALTGISMFVVMVLGLLIVYASRFLMKRRNREFALYLLLGMDKRTISSMLLVESLVMGGGALAIGLPLGIVLSQVMGTFAGRLIMADASQRVIVSGAAVSKTITYFAVIYLVVMLLNARAVGRMQLIDLMQSAKRSERVRLKNPVLCTIVFLLASTMLGFSYYVVGWHSQGITGAALAVHIAIGGLATLLILWSISGLLLRIALSLKDLYFRGLNSFTFRQISSKINTVVFSMTVICLMLFFTICALASAFSLQSGRSTITSLCPADFELKSQEILPENPTAPAFDDIVARYATCGYDLPSHFADYVHFHSYVDPNLANEKLSRLTSDLVREDDAMPVVRISDYNALMRLYGHDELALGADEFMLLCNFGNNKAAYNRALAATGDITIFGHTLHAKHPKVRDGFIDLSSGHGNTGLYLVPDEVVDESHLQADYFMGNYRATTDEERAAVEEQCRAEYEVAEESSSSGEVREDGSQTSFWLKLNTKVEIVDSALGMSTLVTILCLYVGLVFLVASGAILALRSLSECVDSAPRYETLRKIGADEEELAQSLLAQTGFFFLLPLALACFHAIFGMKFMTSYTALFGGEGSVLPIIATTLVILLIYGGYFALTYRGSLRIIRGNE